MADAILQEIKVDRNDAYFTWVKALEFSWSGKFLGASQRSDEFNAIIYLTVKNLMTSMGDKVGQMNPIEILVTSSTYMPVIFTRYCQINILKRGAVIDQTLNDSLNAKINNMNLTNVFQTWTLQSVDTGNKSFILDDSIKHYSFGLNNPVTFIDEFVQEFIVLDVGVERIVDLKPGSSVCGCTLVKLISKKEHSQVWEAKQVNRKIAMKLEPIDYDEKEIKKLSSTNLTKKILEHIKETDIEYLNYQKLKDYPYKLNYFNVDYYHPLRMKVKIMSWLDGHIDKSRVHDKKEFIYAMYDIAYELHKRGLMFNGFCPNHVMIKTNIVGEEIPQFVKSNYRIVDYKYITDFKGISNNIGEYISQALMSGTNSVTPYDDIESLLYTINDIIGNKVIYSDRQDEYIKKTELLSMSTLVSTAITSLRALKQQDIYVNGLMTPANYKSYITEIYEVGVNVNGQNIPGIRTILGNVFNGYNEVAAIEISLVSADYELLQKIKTNIYSSTFPEFIALRSDQTKSNEVCIAILNYQINGTVPALEFQPYIHKYFSY